MYQIFQAYNGSWWNISMAWRGMEAEDLKYILDFFSSAHSTFFSVPYRACRPDS